MSEQSNWGADQPQGPGWWQAADGKWYPPQGQAAPPPPPAYAAAPAYAPAPSGGIEVSFNGPLEVQNWRALLNGILAIPHFIVLWVYGIGASVFGVIAFFQVLFTEQVSPSTHEFLVKYYRYSWRVQTFALFMRNDSPKYGLVGTEYDPGDDAARLSIPRPQRLNRWGPLYKWILAIPAEFVLFFYFFGVFFYWVVAWFTVLFTGKWPQAGREFVVKAWRQSIRINAYLLLTDEKPPITPE
jgi:Domain of unknown function (DUF4389)